MSTQPPSPKPQNHPTTSATNSGIRNNTGQKRTRAWEQSRKGKEKTAQVVETRRDDEKPVTGDIGTVGEEVAEGDASLKRLLKVLQSTEDRSQNNKPKDDFQTATPLWAHIQKGKYQCHFPSDAKIFIPLPLPPVLANARAINDSSSIAYPEGVKHPRSDINANGMYRYDRDFLLQFKDVCKNIPDMPTPFFTPEIGPAVVSRNRWATIADSRSTKQESGTLVPGSADRKSSHRTRSKRGMKPQGGSPPRNNTQENQNNQEPRGTPTVPPQGSPPSHWHGKAIQADPDSPIFVQRKVTGLLNKLTTTNFTPISDMLVTWANKSINENDGKTLKQVAHLIFDKAINEALWSGIYAKLCHKITTEISSEIRVDSIQHPDGNHPSGGQLFRKFILNRCKQQYDRRFPARKTSVATTADKFKEGTSEEFSPYSDAYYAAKKAQRHDIGLARFVGELYKVNLITKRIVHEYIKKLLAYTDPLNEEVIMCLGDFLSNVGALLDAGAQTNAYFSKIQKLLEDPALAAQARFVLQNLLELRAHKWVSRETVGRKGVTAGRHPNATAESRSQTKQPQNQAQTQQTNPTRGSSVHKRGNTPPRVVGDSSKSLNTTQTPSTTGDSPKSPKFGSSQTKPPGNTKKIAEDTDEFFILRNTEKATTYFSTLPAKQHHLLVKCLVSSAIESNEDNAQLVTDLFSMVAAKKLCSVSSFEKGLVPVADNLDDITIDVPNAPRRFARIVDGSKLDDKIRRSLANRFTQSDTFLVPFN